MKAPGSINVVISSTAQSPRFNKRGYKQRHRKTRSWFNGRGCKQRHRKTRSWFNGRGYKQRQPKALLATVRVCHSTVRHSGPRIRTWCKRQRCGRAAGYIIHAIQTCFYAFTSQKYISHFLNYYEFKLLISFLLVDELLSLCKITDLRWMHLWLFYMFLCESIGRFCSVWSVVCLCSLRV